MYGLAPYVFGGGGRGMVNVCVKLSDSVSMCQVYENGRESSGKRGGGVVKP